MSTVLFATSTSAMVRFGMISLVVKGDATASGRSFGLVGDAATERNCASSPPVVA
jgi:hypothetical protein